MRSVFVKVHIMPTKVTKSEAMSTKSNLVSGKDFNSLNGLSKSENSKSVCLCEEGSIQNPVSPHFTQANEA